jgi:outer membrane protein assembly factor BamB
LALIVLVVVACDGQPPRPSSDAASLAWKWQSDAVLDFPNLAGDLDFVGGSLVTLTNDGTLVTGTRIVAIDPDTGKTRWTDSTLTGLVPVGARSFHSAHFVREGDDIVAAAADGSSRKSVVIRFSIATRAIVWQFALQQLVLPESLSVSGATTCFAAVDPGPRFARSVTCLGQDGKPSWSHSLDVQERLWGETEIEIAATRLIVLAEMRGRADEAMASVFELQTGAPALPSFPIRASYGHVGDHHLTRWKEDKVVAFLDEGVAVLDLAAHPDQPRLVASLSQRFPRAPEIVVGGSTAYVMYDVPYPNGGDQPRADVVAAFDLKAGRKLWEKTDAANLEYERVRPMRLQGPDLLYGDHTGRVWILAAGSGAVKRQLLPRQDPLSFIQTLAPFEIGNTIIVSENFGPGPLDYRLAAIK